MSDTTTATAVTAVLPSSTLHIDPEGSPMAAILAIGKATVGLAKDVRMISVPASVHKMGRNAKLFPRTSFRTLRIVDHAVDDLEWETAVRQIRVNAETAGLFTKDGAIRVPATVKVTVTEWAADPSATATVSVPLHSTSDRDGDGNPYKFVSSPSKSYAVTGDGKPFGIDVSVTVSGTSLLVSATVKR